MQGVIGVGSSDVLGINIETKIKIMRITGTCQIEISAESGKLDEKALRKIKNKLTDEFSSVLDSLLMQEYGIENEQMHSCLVDELTLDA